MEIANWILAKVRAGEDVYQEELVVTIRDTFGDNFTYENENGNLAIDKKILVVFREVSGDEVVWERSAKLWRLRNPKDAPGRQQ